MFVSSIDAQDEDGSFGRLLNHAPAGEANVAVRPLFVGDRPRLLMIAIRNIKEVGLCILTAWCSHVDYLQIYEKKVSL